MACDYREHVIKTMMGRVLSVMSSNTLNAIFHTWAEWVEDKRRVETLGKRAVVRMQVSTCAICRCL